MDHIYFQPSLLAELSSVVKAGQVNKPRSNNKNKVHKRYAETRSCKPDKKKTCKKNAKSKHNNASPHTHTDSVSSRVQVWTNSDFPLSDGDSVQPSPYVIEARAKSRNAFYAGNSLSDEPRLSSFPQPPSHWMSHQTSVGSSVYSSSEDEQSTTSTQSLAEITTALKLILNIGDQ